MQKRKTLVMDTGYVTALIEMKHNLIFIEIMTEISVN